jgi:diguanylate cyclase (GGDEF)-like protein
MSELPSRVLGDVLENCSDGVCLVDHDEWLVVWANRRFRDWAGEPSVADQVAIFDWLPDLAANRADFQRVASGESEEATVSIGRAGEIRVRRVEPFVAIFLRPTDALASERVDPLTGLADRAFFLERLGTLLAGDRATDHRCAVLFVDVDGFKQINDVSGHLVGDRVLREVARRLANCVRADDHVARFGGDEFVVLLESIRGAEEADPVAERIRRAFDRPIALPEVEVKLTVSVGVAEAGSWQRSAEELINAADRAMYAAKRAAT